MKEIVFKFSEKELKNILEKKLEVKFDEFFVYRVGAYGMVKEKKISKIGEKELVFRFKRKELISIFETILEVKFDEFYLSTPGVCGIVKEKKTYNEKEEKEQSKLFHKFSKFFEC